MPATKIQTGLAAPATALNGLLDALANDTAANIIADARQAMYPERIDFLGDEPIIRITEDN